MAGMPTGQYAIVRGVPSTYDQCIRTRRKAETVDVELARRQHRRYCEVLKQVGLELIMLEPEDRFPDCCFVEDTAIVVGDHAIISRMGAQSRVGEEVEVREVLQARKEIINIEPPGTIEGGDVLRIDHKVFIGLSTRTNHSAVRQVEQCIADFGCQVIPVNVEDLVHLKADCTYIGNNYLLMFPGRIDEAVFGGYHKITVPREEAYAANGLSINGKVLVSRGYPRTKELIEEAGIETIEMEMSEFRKGEGSLTCLSIVF